MQGNKKQMKYRTIEDVHKLNQISGEEPAQAQSMSKDANDIAANKLSTSPRRRILCMQ